MRFKGFLAVFLFFLAVTFFFFYPVFLRGQISFPGDLVVGYYEPWKSYSFLGYAPGGVPHKAQGIDVARELFPWKHLTVEVLKRGELPFWNPYNFSGNIHLANFQTGVFYPLNVVFFLFSFNLAWTIFIILQPLLACCFTYLLVRELKISRFGSVIASLAFAFCLYFTVWIEYGNVGHAILWFPLALFLVEKIIKEGRIKWAFLFVFVLTLSILAGYIQATIYLFAAVLFFFFFRFLGGKRRTRRERGFKLGIFLGSLVFSLLLSSLQLLPTLEIFSQSARQAYPTEKIPELLLPWFYPLTSFASDFFGNPASRNYWLPGTYIERVSYFGVLPLFFAFLALVKRRKEKTVLFFVILAAVSLLLTLNLAPIRFFYRLKIPIISTTVYTRLLSLFSFSMAVLAGFGIDFWLKTKEKKKVFPLIAIFVGIYFFLWLLTFLAPKIFPSSWWVDHLNISQRNLILPTGITMVFFGLTAGFHFLGRIDKRKRLITRYSSLVTPSAILLLTVFDLFFYFHKITPFSPTKFVYPQTEVMEFLKKEGGINRFWGYAAASIDTNFSTFNQTFSLEGNDPLFISRYGELLAASRNLGIVPREIPRADVVLERGFGPEALREDFYRQRLLNLLGVKYVLHKNVWLGEEWLPDYTTFPEEIYQLIWQKDQWQIYENKTALPRIFLVGDYQVEERKQRIASLIFDLQFPLKEKIILEESLPADFTLAKEATGEIEDLDYQPNRIEFKVNSSGNSLLFLSDNYYPGWKAEMDGQETKIYRADYAFRALALPEGEHEVIFSYKPRSFKLGMTISGIAFLTILTFGLMIKKRFQ